MGRHPGSDAAEVDGVGEEVSEGATACVGWVRGEELGQSRCDPRAQLGLAAEGR